MDQGAGLGTVVILTGPSSSGKTSIAEELRRRTTRPAIFLEGDALDLPPDSRAVQALRQLPPEQVAVLEAQFHLGYYGALASFARQGLHAIGEVLCKSEAGYLAILESTAGLPLLVARVSCDLVVRQEREASRTDRAPGTAAITASQEWVPPSVDVDIDTGTVGAAEAAELIAHRLA